MARDRVAAESPYSRDANFQTSHSEIRPAIKLSSRPASKTSGTAWATRAISQKCSGGHLGPPKSRFKLGCWSQLAVSAARANASPPFFWEKKKNATRNAHPIDRSHFASQWEEGWAVMTGSGSDTSRFITRSAIDDNLSTEI